MDQLLKHREIHFSPLHPDPNQARTAMLQLSDLEGVKAIHQLQPHRLYISYRVDQLTLQMIESALREVGFDLDDSLVNRLKRAVFSYCEDALRASIGVDEVNNGKTPTLTLPRHTLQDPRPDDWRKYYYYHYYESHRFHPYLP